MNNLTKHLNFIRKFEETINRELCKYKNFINADFLKEYISEKEKIKKNYL